MTNNYKPFMGGVPISIERLAKELEAQGHQVTVFAPTYKEQMASDSFVEDANVFRYATCMKRFIGGIVLPNPFDRRIEQEFRKNSYDIIHVHHPMLIGKTAVYLSRKYHIPLAFTYHTRYEQYMGCYTGNIFKFDGFMAFYLHTFLRYCDFVFAPTEGMRKYLVNRCKAEPDRIGVLPTGIERRNYEISNEEAVRIRRKYGAEEIPLLLTVSRMAHEKNVNFLMESLARTKEIYGRPFRVLMIGDGPDRLTLEKRSAELDMEDTVIFTGAISNEQIAPYFKSADGFIFASKTETQGIVVLEAFAGSTPVIAVRATGVEDLVTDGVNGILTEEDTEEYAGKLADFLNCVPAGQDLTEREKTDTYQVMAESAFLSGRLYCEETVAMRAIRYYNDIIADYAVQKRRGLRLRLEGVKG